jgi:hypothetical protein
MGDLQTPSRFMAKTWIFVANLIVFGGLATLSLLLGPLFYFGYMKQVGGEPRTDAGVILCWMSLPFLLLSALAAYNLWARRRPLLQLWREGITIMQIGSSSLDGIPLIPTLIRAAWLIVSTQGFRKTMLYMPWPCFQDAWVSGLPMARQLTIVGSPPHPSTGNLPLYSTPAARVVLHEVAFVAQLDQIADVLKSSASSPTIRNQLPSWHEAR